MDRRAKSADREISLLPAVAVTACALGLLLFFGSQTNRGSGDFPSILLSTSDGIGAALAVARSQLDTAGALALVVMLVGILRMIEYLLMEPVKREVEQWRD